MVIGLVRQIRPPSEEHFHPTAYAHEAVEHLVALPGREQRIRPQRFPRQQAFVLREQRCANQRLVVAGQTSADDTARCTALLQQRANQHIGIDNDWKHLHMVGPALSTHNLQLRQRRRSVRVAGNGPPRFEPFLAGAERADARLHAIGDDKRSVGVEERRDLRLIRLELLKGRPNRGVSRRPGSSAR